MSIDYEIEVLSQNCIYNKSINSNENNRKLKVYFSIPEKGVDEDTGILLNIAGYDAQASSNIYKKMRSEFSDEHNLVTIQCDYFGYEFQQIPEFPYIDKEKLLTIFSIDDVTEIYKNNQFNVDKFFQLGSKYNKTIASRGVFSKQESVENFNDMGMLQSIDNIVAVLNVINILYSNDMKFNSKKIILYGNSHGAYLSYLCNAFAPKLFSLIIDNSAWILPVYLIKNRIVESKFGNLTLKVYYDYLAKSIIDDFEILDLEYLYSKFKNKCSIICYHGTNDLLISNLEKSKFCNSIKNCIYNEISEDKVDNIIFKSTNHGLNADFIELFDYAMKKFGMKFEKDTYLDLENEIVFETSKHKYVINYKNIIPEVQIL